MIINKFKVFSTLECKVTTILKLFIDDKINFASYITRF